MPAGDPAIEVRDLSFRYAPGQPLALAGIDLRLPAGARCLLLGANGAGKTTLLRVLAGKHMVAPGAVSILGRSAFHDTGLAARVALLGGPFPLDVDISVAEVLAGQPGGDGPRAAMLLDLLGIDPGWRLHRASGGQRRRVQVLLGLLREPRVVLMDEVTGDLDLLARADLLALLAEESDRRGVTVVYATHILDGLEGWGTHLCHLSRGRLRTLIDLREAPATAAFAAGRADAPCPPPEAAAGGARPNAAGDGVLSRLLLRWLREERAMEAKR